MRRGVQSQQAGSTALNEEAISIPEVPSHPPNAIAGAATRYPEGLAEIVDEDFYNSKQIFSEDQASF